MLVHPSRSSRCGNLWQSVVLGGCPKEAGPFLHQGLYKYIRIHGRRSAAPGGRCCLRSVLSLFHQSGRTGSRDGGETKDNIHLKKK